MINKFVGMAKASPFPYKDVVGVIHRDGTYYIPESVYFNFYYKRLKRCDHVKSSIRKYAMSSQRRRDEAKDWESKKETQAVKCPRSYAPKIPEGPRQTTGGKGMKRYKPQQTASL